MTSFDWQWEETISKYPQGFGRAEKALFKRLYPLLNDVLDEIKANGKLETVYLTAEGSRLNSLFMNYLEALRMKNTLMDLFGGPQPTWRKFLKETEQFGFKEKALVRMVWTTEIDVALLSTELFKLVMLFHMKDVSYDVSKFNTTMQSSAPKTWPLLKPFVDNEFRNALAHGTYAFLNRTIVLYRDAKLVPFKILKPHEFMMKAKVQHILFVCFFAVLTAKIKSGFLT